MATEKRLIDVDGLKKNMTVLWDQALGFCDCVCVEDIDNAPTVDAIEVVRCHSCKYSEPCKPHKKIWCPRIGRYLNADFYCAEGAKKE